MTENERMELEWKIDELLNGGLDESGRLALLGRIVQDDQARTALDEALTLREQARAAFGYTDEAMGASLQALREHLKDGLPVRTNLPQPAGAHRRPRQNPLWVLWRPTVLLRVVALVLMAVAVYVVVTVRKAPDAVPPHVHKDRKEVMPKLTDDQLAHYGALWSNMYDTADDALPCIPLDNGGGRIHYVTGQGPAHPRRLVLYRCMLLDATNRRLSKVNLLLPADRPVRLPVPRIAADDGKLPVRYDVWIDGAWAGVDLAVGGRLSKQGGVSGRTRIGKSPAEIGRFKVNNKEVRVVLQAVRVPLDVSAT